MEFSLELKTTIHKRFMDSISTLGLETKEILDKIQNGNSEEQVIMEYFYSAMPASDIGNYDYQLFKEYADFGLYLKENSPWSSKIPEDVFLNYVVSYRINNEEIENCRPVLYEALKDRIHGKTMKEAALEVNTWCAEHVTYQATDERTISPLNLIKSSYGRCGEESTLAVSAMRSVGIPARQVYTPRWAHCDDNHAWVEVWCEGEWYFLGACEPEPILNLGWFNDAAARVMLVDTKSALPIKGEEAIEAFGQNYILNETGRYAPVRKFTVIVENTNHEDGKKAVPVEGVQVYFELLNGAELYPIISAVSDKNGRATVSLGLGTIHVHGVKNGLFVEGSADTKDSDHLLLDFSKAIKEEQDGSQDFNFRAPEDSTRNSVRLTEEEKLQRRELIGKAEEKRQIYASSFYKEEMAEALTKSYREPEKIKELLRAAEGNFNEIYDFLSTDFGCENRELQYLMLTSLEKKDYRDVKSLVLKEHFQAALEFKAVYNQEIFVPYILCPRAHFETLTAYRSLLESRLSPQQELVDEMRAKPELVWEYGSKFGTAADRDSERLVSTPEGILKSGLANELSLKILFVAICRTLGIPARINPVDLEAQYYQAGKFHKGQKVQAESISENNKEGLSKLVLVGGTEKWTYLHNWTIAMLKDGVYKSLELSTSKWIEGKLELELTAGMYRLITSSRTPNGNQFARKYNFRLEAGEKKELEIALRQTAIEDLLEDVAYLPFNVKNEKEETLSVDSILGNQDALMVWLEEGREPTEHILNEFIEAKNTMNELDCDILFIIRDKKALENKTFIKARQAIPKSKVFFADFAETAVVMARRMFVNPEKLPLTVLSRNNRGLYACSGYNVGVIDLLVKIMKASKD